MKMDHTERRIVDERAMWEALVTDDNGTPAMWEDLVRKTAPIVPYNRVFFPYWSAYSAFNPASSPEYYGLQCELADEWRAYIPRWEAFLDCNPRCRIAEMMSEMSEAIDASSWPYGREARIAAWVRGGFPEPSIVPWDDRINSPAWRQRLADAAERAGEGWVYYEYDAYSWR